MRLLVTGADGFVGRWLVREAIDQRWEVVAMTGPGGTPPPAWLTPAQARQVTSMEEDIALPEAIQRVAAVPADAVIHLAAIASGAAARRDPAAAMRLNGVVPGQLIERLREAARPPRVLLVSTGEVYGAGHVGPIPEDAPLAPVSPYAASKAAAEAAFAALGPAPGIPVVVARPFPHSGPGQTEAYVLPAMAARLREARRLGTREVRVGTLDVVRDFLDVRDVVKAYLLLLEHGEPGAAYNVASGVGRSLRDCFTRLAELAGVDAEPVVDPLLVRPADIPVLIGDAGRLRAATGWQPVIAFDQTLRDLLDAQAH